MLVFPAQNGVERQTFTFHADSGRLTDKDGSAAGVDFETGEPQHVADRDAAPQNPSPDATL